MNGRMRIDRLLILVAIALVIAAAVIVILRRSGDDDADVQPAEEADDSWHVEPRATLPPIEPGRPPVITWESCGSRSECGVLAVPLDYANPRSQALELALMRIPARNQEKRAGSLLMNPGGPGGSAIDLLKAAPFFLPAEVRDRFDLVAFDPRGVGKSSPVVCHDTLQAFVAVDPSPDDRAEWDALRRETKTFADACAAGYGDILPHLGTINVARDMDRVRQALGDERLTYLGFSYGTVIGAVYADLFPGRVRALVLDGAVDLSLSAEQLSREQARGFEVALDAYLADCAQRKCELAKDGDPGKALDALLARAERRPIPSKTADRPAGPGETVTGVAAALYSRSAWGTLTTALTRAIGGDGSGLIRLTDQYLGRKDDGEYDNQSEMLTAVNCVDHPRPLREPSYEDYQALAREYERVAPRFGRAFAGGDLACALWSAPSSPLTTPRAAGAAPILVVGTTRDPATPYAWAQQMASQLANAVLLSFDGDGHTAVGQGNRCINDAVTAYLVRLELPRPGSTCR